MGIRSHLCGYCTYHSHKIDHLIRYLKTNHILYFPLWNHRTFCFLHQFGSLYSKSFLYDSRKHSEELLAHPTWRWTSCTEPVWVMERIRKIMLSKASILQEIVPKGKWQKMRHLLSLASERCKKLGRDLNWIGASFRSYMVSEIYTAMLQLSNIWWREYSFWGIN